MSKDLPTTGLYRISTDVKVDLGDKFWKASSGKSAEERMPELVKLLVGRDDLDVEAAPGLKSGYITEQNGVQDTLQIDTQGDLEKDICGEMGVSRDNLPPNIPSSYTAELEVFLTAVHESEHVTQYSLNKNPDGSVDVNMSPSLVLEDETIEHYGVGYYQLANRVMAEVDSVRAVMSYLREEGMEDVAQFRMDGKTIGSFTNKFPSASGHNFAHEVATILNYHEKTGEILDPKAIIDAKAHLIWRLQADFGVGDRWISSVVGDSQMSATRNPTREEIVKTLGDFPHISPQKMMHRLQELLDEGEFDGLQKLEAENFIVAAERMRYEPDPTPLEEYAQAYRDQVRNAVDQMYGVPDAEQVVKNDMKVDAPQTP